MEGLEKSFLEHINCMAKVCCNLVNAQINSVL